MSTTFQAYRSTSTTLPVFILSNGDANVNISLWLTDEQALQLASELRAAVAKAPESIITPEAA